MDFIELADKYNDPVYFKTDPVVFPTHFATQFKEGRASLQDVEVAAVFAAHFAWGRRDMIVRDTRRLMDEMSWRPYDYVMKGLWRCDHTSAHRTVMWDDVAAICSRIKTHYDASPTLERLSADGFRTGIFGQKSDPGAANKKIHLLRRWMVRRDGKVDLGLWKDTDPADLIIPLDVHVHRTATDCGITRRRSADFATALEITAFFRNIFPGDPCKGDFCLFGYGISGDRASERK